MPEILPVVTADDILPIYRNTPVGHLLEYHNLGRALSGGVRQPESTAHS